MATRSLNKVMLIGHLGKDPELRYTTNGQAVATFDVATSESWTDNNNQTQERTEWTRVVAWGKLGEIAGEFLAKGKQVYIEGRLQTRSWEDQNGVKRYTTEVNARELIMLGGRGEGAQGGARPPHPADSYDTGAPAAAPTHTGPAAAKTNAAPPASPAPDAMPEDDIPF